MHVRSFRKGVDGGMTDPCPEGEVSIREGATKCPGNDPEQGVRMAEHGGVCRSMHE